MFDSLKTFASELALKLVCFDVAQNYPPSSDSYAWCDDYSRVHSVRQAH